MGLCYRVERSFRCHAQDHTVPECHTPNAIVTLRQSDWEVRISIHMQSHRAFTSLGVMSYFLSSSHFSCNSLMESSSSLQYPRDIRPRRCLCFPIHPKPRDLFMYTATLHYFLPDSSCPDIHTQEFLYTTSQLNAPFQSRRRGGHTNHHR
jgi:hypothetical protein